MKRINILLMLFVVFSACKNQEGKPPATDAAVNAETVGAETYETFGGTLETAPVKSDAEMQAFYQQLAPNDTVTTRFTATVKEVCKAKGCWMKLELGNGEEAMVRFKDYGFFVPTDIAGQEVVVNGMAFVSEMGVEEQRHYAEDGGASPEEVLKITDPKRTFGFEADGVLLKR